MRKQYRFEVGFWPPVLLGILSLLIPIFRNDLWTDFCLGTNAPRTVWPVPAAEYENLGQTKVQFGIQWPGPDAAYNNQGRTELKFVSLLSVMFFGWYLVLAAYRKKKGLQPVRNLDIRSAEPSALYLRPFFSDRKLWLPNPFYSYVAAFGGGGGFALEGYTLRPEEFVGRVLEPHINVLQVGGSEETVGNARIYASDTNWKAVVQEAVLAASVIFILPVVIQDKKLERTLGQATIWELQHLVETGKIVQTVVIMPQAHWTQLHLVRRGWEKARIMASAFGLNMPKYDRRGGVLVFGFQNATWEVSKVFGRGVESRRKLAAGLVEAYEWVKCITPQTDAKINATKSAVCSTARESQSTKCPSTRCSEPLSAPSSSFR